MSQLLQTRITNYLIAQAQYGDLWAIDILSQWEQEIQQNIGFETGWLSKTQSLELTPECLNSSAESEFQSGMSFPSVVVNYS